MRLQRGIDERRDFAEMRMDAAEESDDEEGENTDEMSAHDPTGVG